MALIGNRVRVIACAAVLAGALAGSSAAAGTLRLGLRETVERGLAESHLVKAGAHEVERAGEGVRKARALRILPEVTVSAGTGLVPEARGNVVHSPDDSNDLDDLGPYYRLELRLVQPLWTFGKLDAAETLALKGLAAQQARSALTGQNVAFQAARAYWALAAADRGDEVARDMRRDFDQLSGEVEKRLADESSGVDDADLLEVRSKAYSIDRIYLDARELRRLSADALRLLLALPADTEPAAVNEPPPQVAIAEAGLDAIVSRAVDAHPEVRAVTAAADTLAAKVALQRVERNPVIFLAGGAGIANANNRDEQDNPWVKEDFNYERIGAEVGLRWDANLHRKNIDVSEALAEHRAVLEQLAGVRSKVEVEVRQALREGVRARALLDSARASLKASRSRLRLVLDTWETGLGEVGDVLDAYEDYYRLRAEEPQREYELNLALARLGFVLGDVNLYLEWVQRGNVEL